jgi:hypothetical protein
MAVKCPICGNSLADDQYNLATEKLNEKLGKMNLVFANEQAMKFEEEKTRLIRRHQSEIHSLESNRDSEFKTIEDKLKKSYETQIEHIQKSYNELLKQHSEQVKVLESQLKNSYEEQLKNKDSTINELLHEQVANKKKAADDAKSSVQQQLDKYQNEILQRDLQLLRFKAEVESLKKQITQTQAELKGEAGELDLYTKLTEAFPDDQFVRQKRGKSTGDVIQRIRTKAGIIDTPIVYDNKQAESITANDIVKAKKYLEIHAAKYVLIVSSKLPKKDMKSEYLGDRDGILLVHPSIVLPFAKIIRDAIVDLSLLSNSDKERDSKEAMLYQYIRSQEFTSRIAQIANIETKMLQQLEKEEKDHQKIWRERKDFLMQTDRQHSEISLKIQSILSQQPQQETSTKRTALEVENRQRRSKDNTPSSGCSAKNRLET